jgi:hypothetical protein
MYYHLTTKIRCIRAAVAAIALVQVVCAQTVSDPLMKDDPRLAAAYHFAEFAGGAKTIKVYLPAHKVVFNTRGVEKEWNCEGMFVPKQGSQQSRCYLRQTNTAIALVYESTVVVAQDGSTAVSLQSQEDRLHYGNGVAGASLLPKWLPNVPPGGTLESARILYSGGGYETVDALIKMPDDCIRYYAKALNGLVVGKDELRWSDRKNGLTLIVSPVPAGQLCKLTGTRVPGQTH